MEFKREDVVIPKVMGTLAEKGIPTLNNLEVSYTREALRRSEKKRLRDAYLKEHPLVKFASGKGLALLVLIFCFIGTGAYIVHPTHFALLETVSIVALVLLMVCAEPWANSKVSAIRTEPWQKSPFKEFRGEYNKYGKSVAYNLCSCYQETDRGCFEPTIKLEVEWHEASKTRFLVASNPDNPQEEPYYVDYWETS